MLNKSCLIASLMLVLMACATDDSQTPIAWNSYNNLQMQGVVQEADIPPDIKTDSWARLPAANRATLNAEGQRAYDLMTSPGQGYENGLRGPLGMWVYSPEMATGAWLLRQRASIQIFLVPWGLARPELSCPK